NFSFGDYFKKEAIEYAWDLLTNVFQLDPDRLWITIYEDDDEADAIWREIPNVDPNKIQRLGAKDNFWSMGDTGPCGPCSEIHYDHGPEYGSDPNGPAGETDRYVEIWNLVFMQYNRDSEGTLTPLPKPSIDTGMGLERIAAILQGVYSNYDTDVFQSIIQQTARWANTKYNQDDETDIALRVIADHARSVTFLVADGIMPSNEGRGYVLRRIARRAIRYGVRIGLKEAFLYKAAAVVIEQFSSLFPDLHERKDFILEVIKGEEERFSETLEKGLQILEDAFEQSESVLSGDIAFQLHDTFGFPLDLTRLIASERGFSVDEVGFQERMKKQKEAGRANWKGSGQQRLSQDVQERAKRYRTVFCGYDSLSGQSRILSLLNEAQTPVERLKKGEKGALLTYKTPFYSEGGGQIGDKGQLQTATGSALVTDTQRPVGELTYHYITVSSGELSLESEVDLSVDEQHRYNTRRNHTATHLLHAALRNHLGTHVTQKGSLVTPNRLRFDFAHHKPVSQNELIDIQKEVQEEIFKNRSLDTSLCSQEEAKAKGALALFGEKYGDEVRVIQIGDYSTELCGGTHVERTGEIGVFHILSESGIAAGVRRIEALTGQEAIAYLQRRESQYKQASLQLRVQNDDLDGAIDKLLKEKRDLDREIRTLQRKIAQAKSGDLTAKAKEINGIKVLAAEFEGDPKMLRSEADRLRSALGSAIIVLGSRKKGVQLIVAVTKDLTPKIHAGKLIKDIAAVVDGRGGGRPDMAQAGGKNPDALPEALEKAYELAGNIFP
ncbi:MAG: alanine--tRNA ligase, partial [Myxococcota bacterium]|nr:alanine--tRNA ligase [Myxococcota bacterium]